MILIAAVCAVSYLLGSIPFGLLYSRARGIDIRNVGSKNIGATNVSRQFGFISGFLPVFLLDMAKGAIPVYMAGTFIHTLIGRDGIMVLAGISAIIGHMFPIYLSFKGGKGVATGLGAFILIAPYEMAVCILVFILTLSLARYFEPSRKSNLFFKDLQKGVGLSSCIAALIFPFCEFLFEPSRKLILIISIPVVLLLIYQHRSNLIKIFKGERS